MAGRARPKFIFIIKRGGESSRATARPLSPLSLWFGGFCKNVRGLDPMGGSPPYTSKSILDKCPLLDRNTVHSGHLHGKQSEPGNKIHHPHRGFCMTDLFGRPRPHQKQHMIESLL